MIIHVPKDWKKTIIVYPGDKIVDTDSCEVIYFTLEQHEIDQMEEHNSKFGEVE